MRRRIVLQWPTYIYGDTINKNVSNSNWTVVIQSQKNKNRIIKCKEPRKKLFGKDNFRTIRWNEMHEQRKLQPPYASSKYFSHRQQKTSRWIFGNEKTKWLRHTPDLFGRTFYLYANRSAFNQSGSLRRSLTRIYLTFPHYKKHISENCDASWKFVERKKWAKSERRWFCDV